MTVLEFKTLNDENIELLIEQLQAVHKDYGLISLCVSGACKDGEILQGYWTEQPYQSMGLLNSLINKINEEFS